MESPQIPRTYRDLLGLIRFPDFQFSNPTHAAAAATRDAKDGNMDHLRRYADAMNMRAARPRHADRAAPGFIDSIQGATERGFAQEAIFNIVYLFHARHVRRGEIVPSGGNFSAGNAFAAFDINAFMDRNIRQGGDASDLTMFTPDEKTIVVFSSKCRIHYTNDGMDVAKIKEIGELKYPGKALEIRFVVNDRAYFTQCIGAAHDTTTIVRNGHIVYDWDSIDDMIAEIRAVHPDPFAALCGGITGPCVHAAYNSRTTYIRLRFGQIIVSERIAAAGARRVINGAMCRFGKSYCMAADVIRSTRRLFVFVTTQPKTIPAIRAIFATHDEFKVFDMFDLNSKKPAEKAAAKRFAAMAAIPDGKKIIIFISIQTLKRRGGKAAIDLGRHDPLCIFDEFHVSAGTEQSMIVLAAHGLLDAQMIFYSATYGKIAAHYNVAAANIITWGAEDNALCARLDPGDIDALGARHGRAIVCRALAQSGAEAIRAHYGTLPRMKFIIDSPTARCVTGLRDWIPADDTRRGAGFSFDAVKMIEKDATRPGYYKLANEEHVLEYFGHMLGRGFPDGPDNTWVVSTPGLLEQYKALYRADGQTTHGKIVPVYLGAGNIDGSHVADAKDTLIGITGNLIIECIKKHARGRMFGYGTRYVIENYDAKEAANPEEWFDQLCRKHESPDFIILFLGRALTTGVTNRHCDLIKLTSRIGSADLFWQTICRAMNEAPERKKKYAYIAVDNYQSLAPMLDIVRGMKMPHESERGAWERLIGQNVFSIVDAHHGDALAATAVYTPPEPGALYAAIRDTVPYADNLRRFVGAVNFGDIKAIRGHLVEITKKAAMACAAADAKAAQDALAAHGAGGIPDGITREAELKRIAAELAAGTMKPKEAKKAREAAARTPEEWATERKAAAARVADADNNSVMVMMDVIVTTFVILTIDADVRIENMVEYLRDKKEVPNRWDICIERCQISFSKDAVATAATVMMFIEIMMREDNRDIINESLATLRETLKHLSTKSEFYEVCIGCIATTEIERAKNAEVPTPLPLVREMLAQIPAAAWRADAKIWDPAVGKGAFMVVAYEILFDALAAEMPDPAVRHVHILEKMLYFSDINPFNIHITRMILDPDGKAAMNSYLGDSLEQKFDDGFKLDMVIGNPPFNKGGVRSSKSDGAAKGTKTIWPLFVARALSMLKPGGYLAYITPLSWLGLSHRSPHKLHVTLLSKYILWMRLWDSQQADAEIGGAQPMSVFVICNIDGGGRDTHIVSTIRGRRMVDVYEKAAIGPQYSVPLGYYGIFSKIRDFIALNECKISFESRALKKSKKDPQIELPDDYKIEDGYCVDRFSHGKMWVCKYPVQHRDAKQKKLIIANKCSLNGIFIDDGRLGLCGNNKFYILGDELETIKRMLSFKLSNMVCYLTKYNMGFVNNHMFEYIPDIRKIVFRETATMSEAEFYEMLGLTDEEIALVMQFGEAT